MMLAAILPNTLVIKWTAASVVRIISTVSRLANNEGIILAYEFRARSGHIIWAKKSMLPDTHILNLWKILNQKSQEFAFIGVFGVFMEFSTRRNLLGEGISMFAIL